MDIYKIQRAAAAAQGLMAICRRNPLSPDNEDEMLISAEMEAACLDLEHDGHMFDLDAYVKVLRTLRKNGGL